MDAHVVSGGPAGEQPGDADRLFRWQAWVLLGGYFLVHNLTHVAYDAMEHEFPARQQLILTFSFAPLLWYWLIQECRGLRFPVDMGFFLLVAWWALLPYYLWKAQRWRGLGKIALLGALWTATYVSSWLFSWVIA